MGVQSLFMSYGHTLVTTMISAAAGSIITTGTGANAWGQTSAAFDGTTSQASTASANCGAGSGASNNGAANFLGKDWGAGVNHRVTKLIIYGPNNNSILGGGSASTWQFDGSNDNSSWTALDSGATGAGNGETITRTSTILATTAYRYHRVGVAGNGVNTVLIAELQFFEDL